MVNFTLINSVSIKKNSYIILILITIKNGKLFVINLISIKR